MLRRLDKKWNWFYSHYFLLSLTLSFPPWTHTKLTCLIAMFNLDTLGAWRRTHTNIFMRWLIGPRYLKKITDVTCFVVYTTKLAKEYATPSAHMDETPPGAAAKVYTLPLPVQYRPTRIPGWPEELKSEESDKSWTEKDTNRSYGIIKHPRTCLIHCTGVMNWMKTGRLTS